MFSDLDVARAQLIRDLREDLGVNDEGVSVVCISSTDARPAPEMRSCSTRCAPAALASEASSQRGNVLK